MTEQERAAKAYEEARGQRAPEGAQLGRDNARIGGANAAGSQGGGAR